jgi:hypothetical protein
MDLLVDPIEVFRADHYLKTKKIMWAEEASADLAEAAQAAYKAMSKPRRQSKKTS